jgi:putative tryptophan/tyrosine transport system substrate-binding protein
MRRRDFIKAAIIGSAVARPLTAHAQQTSARMPIIGVLFHAGNAEQEGPYFTGLVEGFRDLGYIEGRNIEFEHRFPNEEHERFTAMAAELVSRRVDVLVAVGDRAAAYAKNATSTIPIVFVLVPDPVGSHLVDSFAQPGGNVTGLSNDAAALLGRRLQLLKEMIPGLARVAQLANPNTSIAKRNIEASQAAAAELGLAVHAFEARSAVELTPAFDAMANAGMQAVLVGASEGLPMQARDTIAKLALDRHLALCTYSRETFEPGALMSYGTDHVAICRRAAVYVDKILKGARPSELPVEGPSKFEFLLNLKTAKALGIDVPGYLQQLADEVIG